jgi:peptidyl-prolyl cis-trans isomerase B (cyclophilin B)
MNWSYERTRGERGIGRPLPYAAVRKLTILIAALAIALAGCGDDKNDSRDSSGGDDKAGSATVGQPTTPESSNGCKTVAAPKAKPDGSEKKPKLKLDNGTPYHLRVDTSCGTFTILLDQAQSPNAAASLVALARAKFFNGTVFHRIVPDFVIQGGDPTGTGSGGPGYSTRDKPPAEAGYTKGVVAMAKTGEEPAGTAGSQFYVVTGADAGLPPDYAIVGKVEDGQAVVDRIGQLGGPDEKPTQPVVINSITVQEG